MGRVNIVGLGTVDIEGDTPNEQEIEVFKRMAAVKGADKITDGPAEQVTESFFQSPSFGRILTEAGLAIAGSVATGGLALPGLALRAGMLARPFLTQLAKSSIGAGVGGGTGAAVAQTFDPKEDVVKEILRATTEGALAEAIGAPVVIKGGQIVSKLLGSKTPKQFNDLLDGAQEAELALQAKSVQILKGVTPQKFAKMSLEEKNKILKEITSKGFVADNKTVLKFAEANALKTTAKEIDKLGSTAKEMASGLTPGVKSSNRTLEIIENISQKSLIGGGAITKRYEAAKMVGDLIAKDMLAQYKVVADSSDVGKLFLESLGGARGAFEKTKNKLYQNVDDILKEKGVIDAEIIPVNTLRESIDSLTKFYDGTLPKGLSEVIPQTAKKIDERVGKYSFAQLDSLRKRLVDLQFGAAKTEKAQIGKLIKTIDSSLDDAALNKIIPKKAVDAKNLANDFFREGNDVFSRGVVSQLLKNAGEDGLVLGKDAKAIQNVFKIITGNDNLMNTKVIFREIDALTGKNVPEGDGFKELAKMIDPVTKKPMLTVAQGQKLKDSVRGHYLANAMRKAEKGSKQFGKYIDSDAFSKAIDEGEGKLRKFLFQGNDAKKLEELQNTLAFAQGDLSRLPGIPGGIFIQLKQAGAAGTILSLGGVGGTAVGAGLLGGFVPAAGILLAPAVASKIMLNPKFSNLIFKESAKIVAKGENTPSKMAVLYRQIIGRMLTDGVISKEERDDAIRQVDNFEKKSNIQAASKSNQPNLPEVQPSNFPVIDTGTSPMNTAAGGGSNTELAQALNLFNKGGIVSAKKNF